MTVGVLLDDTFPHIPGSCPCHILLSQKVVSRTETV